MKKLIIGVVIILASIVGCNTAKAQNVQREGKTFIQQNNRGSSSNNDIATTYTWKDSKGNEYPIVLHKYSRGDKAGRWTCYVVRKSNKTGKEYKYYLPDGETIAATIKREMGI